MQSQHPLLWIFCDPFNETNYFSVCNCIDSIAKHCVLQQLCFQAAEDQHCFDPQFCLASDLGLCVLFLPMESPK